MLWPPHNLHFMATQNPPDFVLSQLKKALLVKEFVLRLKLLKDSRRNPK